MPSLSEGESLNLASIFGNRVPSRKTPVQGDHDRDSGWSQVRRNNPSNLLFDNVVSKCSLKMRDSDGVRANRRTTTRITPCCYIDELAFRVSRESTVTFFPAAARCADSKTKPARLRDSARNHVSSRVRCPPVENWSDSERPWVFCLFRTSAVRV